MVFPCRVNICLCGINGNLKSFHGTNTNKEQHGLMHCKYELQIVYCMPPHAAHLRQAHKIVWNEYKL